MSQKKCNDHLNKIFFLLFFFIDIPLTKKYNIQHCNENINNNNKKKKRRQQPPQIGKNCT